MKLFSNTRADVKPESEENPIIEKDTDKGTDSSEESVTSISKIVEEDSLLIQIDEFRKKAEALQALINDRQDRVIDLEEEVRQKESKNSKLQEELSKKQEVLNSVLEDMKQQFDILANRVDTSINNALDEAKAPVIEKIHTENVRLYRNLYDFVKEDYDPEKLKELISDLQRANRPPVIAVLVLSAVNTILLILMVLINLRII